MITKCFVTITLISFVYAVFSGNISSLTNAVIDGASQSVQLSLELCGMSCLWCGIMQVFKDAGILEQVCKFLSPVLSLIFPESWKSGIGKSEITAAISANLLGIGNAATPYALSAMRELDRINPYPHATSCDMAAFVILGTSSLNIAPTTLITLRRAAGSAEPYSIIIPVWICSLSCAILGIILIKILNHTALSGKKNA